MNITPYIKDLDALSVKVGWLHPQVPQSSRSDIETAVIAMRAAVSALNQAQSRMNDVHKSLETNPEAIWGPFDSSIGVVLRREAARHAKGSE